MIPIPILELLLLFMKFISIFVLLACASSYVVFQSDTTDTVAYGIFFQQAAHNTYPYGVSIPGTTAKWIWAQNWNTSSCPTSITITQIFTATCRGNITIFATADNYFTIYLNSISVLTGNNWKVVYNYTFTPICGRTYNFTIVAHNLGGCSATNPAGVIYGAIQNTTGCYTCPSRQAYNFSSCSCQCDDRCQSIQPQIWLTEPACTCGCKKRVICNSHAFWNERICGCTCIPSVCDSGFFFNKTTCQCQKRNCIDTILCIKGFYYNFFTCRCQPSGVIIIK